MPCKRAFNVVVSSYVFTIFCTLIVNTFIYLYFYVLLNFIFAFIYPFTFTWLCFVSAARVRLQAVRLHRGRVGLRQRRLRGLRAAGDLSCKTGPEL